VEERHGAVGQRAAVTREVDAPAECETVGDLGRPPADARVLADGQADDPRIEFLGHAVPIIRVPIGMAASEAFDDRSPHDADTPSGYPDQICVGDRFGSPDGSDHRDPESRRRGAPGMGQRSGPEETA
jgi:hypothetical protein